MNSFKLFITLVCLSTFAYGQECKYDSEKKDSATGATQKTIAIPVSGSGDTESQVILESRGSEYWFGFAFSVIGKEDTAIERGELLSIILENDQLITMAAADNFQPQIKSNGLLNYSTYKPFYVIGKSDLEKMQSLSSKAIKLKIGTLGLTVDIKKNSERLKEAAACVGK